MPSLTPEMFAALCVFALVSSITPGPNNAMLMASGANFGFRATAPHLMGVIAGFALLMLSVGLGLSSVFAAFPVLHPILAVAGAGYLLWLAWKIATSDGTAVTEASGRPQRFWPVVAFQWVNVKGWAVALGAVTAYAPRDSYVANVVLICVVFSVVNLLCAGAWAGFGWAMRGALSRPGALRAFNVVMALLLAASVLPVLLEIAQGSAGMGAGVGSSR